MAERVPDVDEGDAGDDGGPPRRDGHRETLHVQYVFNVFGRGPGYKQIHNVFECIWSVYPIYLCIVYTMYLEWGWIHSVHTQIHCIYNVLHM